MGLLRRGMLSERALRKALAKQLPAQGVLRQKEAEKLFIFVELFLEFGALRLFDVELVLDVVDFIFEASDGRLQVSNPLD